MEKRIKRWRRDEMEKEDETGELILEKEVIYRGLVTMPFLIGLNCDESWLGVSALACDSQYKLLLAGT
ncbi:hypothetical protein M569_14535 [Genlisea aurea]|uniref:Uncharacterized protein n=1 Tax=Genlisea aurea TaxID=192259 RepID=S8C098_9LAMI|nr:hypothetical protein M569_14535 [Genlisea aurea]